MLYVSSFFFLNRLSHPPSPVFSLFFSVEPSRNTSAPLDRGGSITFSARGNEMKRNETKRDAYSVNRGGKAPVKKRKTRDESRGNYRRSAESVRDIRLRARRTALVSLFLSLSFASAGVESLYPGDVIPRRRLVGGDEGEPSRRSAGPDAMRVSLAASIFPTSATCVRIGPRPMLRLRKERRERVHERE